MPIDPITGAVVGHLAKKAIDAAIDNSGRCRVCNASLFWNANITKMCGCRLCSKCNDKYGSYGPDGKCKACGG
jgi:hypothetical protein